MIVVEASHRKAAGGGAALRGRPPGQAVAAAPLLGVETVRYLAPAATLGDVAGALGALGLSSRELASVLEAMRSAGSLEAEVVIQ